MALKKQNLEILVNLITSEGKDCPPDYFFPLEEKILLNLSQKNKTVPYLLHLSRCQKCREKISSGFLEYLEKVKPSILFGQTLFAKEKRMIGAFCRKTKIKAVLIKDLSSFKKVETHKENLFGLDLDLLVCQDDLEKLSQQFKRKGYQTKKNLILKDKYKKIYYREIHFLSAETNLIIDVHTKFTIPHHLEQFPFFSEENVEKANQEVIDHSYLDKSTGLYLPSKEYFLFTLIFRYLGSDLMKGLRSLSDIGVFALTYQNEIDWQRFWEITNRFKITNFAIFIFLLNKKVFAVSPDKGFQYVNIPARVEFLAKKWPVEKIAIFPSNTIWNHDRKEVKEMYFENLFLKLYLAPKIDFVRLLRPRIILFVLKLL